MSDRHDSIRQTSPLRSVLRYDPDVGHRFVPNQAVRMRHPDGDYFLVTDGQGFRNGRIDETNVAAGEQRIVVLGDSFAAGDGVANEHRFSEQLENDLDCVVTNLAVPGTGCDQQLLIYRKFGHHIAHDVVVWAPHLDDLKRNRMTYRQGIDRSSCKWVQIPKPYFELLGGSLALRNVPVPTTRTPVEAKVQSAPQRPSALRKAASRVRVRLEYRLLGRESYPELSDEASPEWRLMHAIFEALRTAVGTRSLVVVPIPDASHVVYGGVPRYLSIFRRYERHDAVRVVDVLPALRAAHGRGKRLYLNGCGHFTPHAHGVVAASVRTALPDIRPRSVGARRVASRQRHSYVLGISALYHDAAAALLRDGEVVAAVQEERFTRVKHDRSFPTHAIRYCLEEARIGVERIEAVCYYDNEALTVERTVANLLALPDNRTQEFWTRVSDGLYAKLQIPRLVRTELGYEGPMYRTLHHASHAASAFYPSPFDEAAILVADGVGEWATTSMGRGRGHEIELITEQRYPHSIGLLYSAFTSYCGFKVNSGEYKLMGLAPYGRPRYLGEIGRLADVREDGSLRLDLSYFSYQNADRMVSDRFCDLFGLPPRDPESLITQAHMDIAASIQLFTEEILLRTARHVQQVTGSTNLVMAGGVALNCVANGRLLREGPFEGFWVQPASGDAGGALGSALAWYFSPRNGEATKRRVPMTTACLGPAFSDEEIDAFLESRGYAFHRFRPGLRERTIAEFLRDGFVVGYFSGRMEFGPRALGSRSILGDPRDPTMQSKLNMKIKFRESFRPFAPAVLRERVSEYFELDRESPYMLLVAPVRRERRRRLDGDLLYRVGDMRQILRQPRSDIPAVTHVDYSARVQTVEPENNRFFDVIKEFDRLTGCAVVINTSFNVRGEPIVCTPADAYTCFMRTDMDALVLGNRYLLKGEQPHWQESEDWRETFVLD